MRYLGASTVFHTLIRKKVSIKSDISRSHQHSQKRNPSPKSIPNGIHSTDDNSTLLSTMSTNLICPRIDNSRNTIGRTRQEERKELQSNGDIPDS